ncbi:MAG: pilin [Patescibacteria group bacterium]
MIRLGKIKKRYLSLIIFVVLAFIFVMPIVAQAALNFQNANQGIETSAQSAGVQTSEISIIIANIIKALLSLVGMIFLILFIYGGFKWMTAGGAPDKIEKAKKLLVNAVIGLAIITAAYTITFFISQVLEGSQSNTTETTQSNP